MTKGPKRGDLVRVDWIDICSDPTGDPDDAALSHRQTFGLYWGRRADDGVPAVVIAMTADDDNTSQAGWWIFPESCVEAVAVLRKGAADL